MAGFSQYPILQPESFAFETITEGDLSEAEFEGGWRAATVTGLEIEIWVATRTGPKLLGRMEFSLHVGTPIILYKGKDRGKHKGLWIKTNEAQNVCANAANSAVNLLTRRSDFRDLIVSGQKSAATQEFAKTMQGFISVYIPGARVSLNEPPGIWVTPKKAVYR